MELHGLCIEDVGTALRIRCFRNCTAGTARGRVLSARRSICAIFGSAAIPAACSSCASGASIFRQPVIPGRIVRSQRPAGHYRHKHRTGHRLHRPPPTPLPSERRRPGDCLPQRSASPVEHMVPGFFYIVGCQVFERQHSLNIQISCSGDQFFSFAFSAVSWYPIRWQRLYTYFPSTKSYFLLCQPVGLTSPIEPRFSVGIVSVLTEAYATPHRPSASRSL